MIVLCFIICVVINNRFKKILEEFDFIKILIYDINLKVCYRFNWWRINYLCLLDVINKWGVYWGCVEKFIRFYSGYY